MARIAVFAVVLALLTWFLHRRLVRATGMPTRWARIADTALVLLAVLTLIGMGSGEVFPTSWARPVGFLGWVWLASWLYLIPGLLIIGACAGVNRLVRKRREEPEMDPAKRRTLQFATAAVTLAALGTAGYGVYEASNPKVSRIRVPLARLPEGFDGYRIALITDLHVGPARGVDFTRKVVEIVNAQNVDLIAIGGDLVDGTVAKVAPDLAPLADLQSRDGIFGVSGNHEFYADDGGKWLDVWETLGITTLRNSRTSITHEGDTIDIVGIHDYTSPAPYEPNLTAALEGRDPNTFALLLAHEPRQALEASELGIDLQLSGHTHGGQMWPLRYLVPLQQPSVQGLDKVGNTVLYTTRGAGAWGPPVRVGAPPEITVLELVRE
ncbi:metallophosphoesterase [Rhodococcus sp. KBS0724]|uniref:metallophosphoesterase n=1 Tax=Rhodococcus sp. KBS0724 TaxID=1179674 RepID=UPI00110EAC34|nr:metallophosphoesterase [Rhodococcus sp. KBS0724]TSD47605.1 metallophosphoesterase [Rhodococcus sp. KBS0724]